MKRSDSVKEMEILNLGTCGTCAFRCAVHCEAKKCCKKYKRGKRCKSCPKK